jgi:hypothetical protein
MKGIITNEKIPVNISETTIANIVPMTIKIIAIDSIT